MLPSKPCYKAPSYPFHWDHVGAYYRPEHLEFAHSLVRHAFERFEALQDYYGVLEFTSYERFRECLCSSAMQNAPARKFQVIAEADRVFVGYCHSDGAGWHRPWFGIWINSSLIYEDYVRLQGLR